MSSSEMDSYPPPVHRDVRNISLVELEIDVKFIRILPAIEINFHCHEFEIGWLVFTVIFKFKPKYN